MSERDAANRQLFEQVQKLPRTFEQEVPTDYIDSNGHMNMMYYTLIANQGMGRFVQTLGLHRETMHANQRGFFALRQVVSFLNELREGEEFAVHSGLVAYDHKRLHFMHYVVSLDKNCVASSDERVAMYIDLTKRRSTEFEPEVLAQLKQVRAELAETNWQPQLSGAIELKS